jgi:hypothetical protein
MIRNHLGEGLPYILVHISCKKYRQGCSLRPRDTENSLSGRHWARAPHHIAHTRRTHQHTPLDTAHSWCWQRWILCRSHICGIRLPPPRSLMYTTHNLYDRWRAQFHWDSEGRHHASTVPELNTGRMTLCLGLGQSPKGIRYNPGHLDCMTYCLQARNSHTMSEENPHQASFQLDRRCTVRCLDRSRSGHRSDDGHMLRILCGYCSAQSPAGR